MRARASFVQLKIPQLRTTLSQWLRVVIATHREPSALYCWILEILYSDLKGRRALLRVPFKVGRSVCLCWAKSKPKGPNGELEFGVDLRAAQQRSQDSEGGDVGSMVGEKIKF